MQLKSIALTFALLTSTTVLAAPSLWWSCPNDWTYCGQCLEDGDGCKIAGLKYPCAHSTTCAGENGGKGAVCGTSNSDLTHIEKDLECPDKKE